jgi:hypothetical protein
MRATSPSLKTDADPTRRIAANTTRRKEHIFGLPSALILIGELHLSLNVTAAGYLAKNEVKVNELIFRLDAGVLSTL